uniref:Putative signal-transduction protein containing cAMP-binding and CBS domains n=1 Tax=Desulfovibrio sp. U5L TaxID=596152 RepID=I2PXE6_9BACT
MFQRKVGELAKRPHLVAADASVTQAAAVMAREGVSCLAAVTGAKVVGFLTERDLVRHLDVDLEPHTPIREFLSRPTGAIARDLSVSEAVKLMLERRVRHLAVVDFGGSLLGLVTDKELVDALAVDFMVESATCRQLMRPDTPALPPDRPVREALALMRLRNVGCILVVADGRPAGIFSERDATTRIMGRPERLAEPLSEHMSAPVVVVPADALVYKVILFMRQRGVRRVAAIETDGTLSGILTQQDILAYARRMG